MSSYDGYLHERDAKTILRVMIPAAITLAASSVVLGNTFWQVAIGLVIGAFGGFAVTPDADHVAMTREEYRAMKKWGLLGSLLVAYMTPYAYLIPHRSKLSHTLVPGTLIRIAYVSIIPTLLVYMSMKWLGFGSFPWMMYVGIIFAWSVQDTFHYIRDGIGVTGTRRKKRKARKW